MAGYNGFQMDREFKWFNCLSAECPLSPSLSLALTYSCAHALKQAHSSTIERRGIPSSRALSTLLSPLTLL